MDREPTNEGSQWDLEATSQSEFYKIMSWIVGQQNIGDREFARFTDRDDIRNILDNTTRLGEYICVRDYAGVLKATGFYKVEDHQEKTIAHEPGLAVLICGENREFDSKLSELLAFQGQCSDDSLIVLMGKSNNKLSFQDIFFKKPMKSKSHYQDQTEWIDTTRTFDPILIYPHGSRYEKHENDKLIHPDNFRNHRLPPRLPACIEDAIFEEALKLCYGVAEDPKRNK